MDVYISWTDRPPQKTRPVAGNSFSILDLLRHYSLHPSPPPLCIQNIPSWLTESTVLWSLTYWTWHSPSSPKFRCFQVESYIHVCCCSQPLGCIIDPSKWFVPCILYLYLWLLQLHFCVIKEFIKIWYKGNAWSIRFDLIRVHEILVPIATNIEDFISWPGY